MESNVLTSIERELVLQYLIDGNVPVTVTPIDTILKKDKNNDLQSTDESIDSSNNDNNDKSESAIRPTISTIFPVAIKAEQLKVLKQGIILLTNPPKSVKDFTTKKVRVEFYFNRLGLYFITELKNVSSGLALVIPSEICRIVEFEKERKLDFCVNLFYSCSDKTDVNIKCFPKENYRLFSKPIWSDVPENIQHKTKSYLEKIIVHARKAGTAGNGLQLIPVCRYLAESREKMQSVKGRINPLDIIYADYERIVFGSDTTSMKLESGCEYAIEMAFPIESTVIKTRNMILTCFVEAIYTNDEDTFKSAVCKFTSIKEEDARFLYEKTTNKKFM